MINFPMLKTKQALKRLKKIKKKVMRLTILPLFVAVLFLISCDGSQVDVEPEEEGEILFEKVPETSPFNEKNQDRITDNVWITRGNDGGQIFNVRVAESYDKSRSPIDTEWAIGFKEDVENLSFDTFRNTIRPQDVLGENLVVHLISDDIYLNVKFTKWSSSKGGGFAYIRDAVTQ